MMDDQNELMCVKWGELEEDCVMKMIRETCWRTSNGATCDLCRR